MSINWNIYKKRLNANGSTERERQVERLKTKVVKHIDHNPSFKDILLNGELTQLVINTGTKPHYKEFETLPGQTVKLGDYVEWSNRTWLVYEADADDEIYIDGKIQECNYLLKWQNELGKVKERWCVTQNAVQYNNGESGNSTITLGSDQLMILIPYDEETIKIRRGKRFFISNDLEEPMVYKLTRPDSTTYVKDGHGYLCIMVTEDQTNSENDRKDLMLCDYVDIPIKPDNPNQSTILSQISCTSPTIKVGAPYRTFKCSIMDVDGNTLDDIGVWTINCNFADKLIPNITGNQIKIKISDEYQELIGQEFELIFNNSTGTDSTKIVISIEENI